MKQRHSSQQDLVLMAALAGLIAGLAAYSEHYFRVLPWFDVAQVAFAVYVVRVTLLAAFAISALYFRHSVQLTSNIVWLNRIVGLLIRVVIAGALSLTVTLAAIALLSALRFSSLAALEGVGLALFVGVYVAALAYLVANLAIRLSVTGLLQMGVLVFGLGLALAAVNASDTTWLTGALSELGTDTGAAAFNLAFIVAGVMLLALLVDVLDDLNVLRLRGVFATDYWDVFRFLLPMGAICLAGVGVFVWEGSTLILHNFCAHFALLAFLAGMIFLPRILPELGLLFTRASYLAAAACVLSVVGWALGLWSFTIGELLLLGISLAWIGVFQARAARFIKKHDPALLEVIGQNVVAWFKAQTARLSGG